MMDLKLGYTCPGLCNTQITLESALLRLVYHDRAADRREGINNCTELEWAIDVLKEHCGYTDGVFGLCKDLP
jgi:hypothetical protein